MTRVLGLILAGGLLLGEASAARAQVSVSVGNPWTGRGITVGAPYGYGVYPGYAPGFNSFGYGGWPGYGVTSTNFYSSAYVAPGYYAPGWAPSGYAVPSYGVTTYSYGYPSYGWYGYRRGILGRRVWGYGYGW